MDDDSVDEFPEDFLDALRSEQVPHNSAADGPKEDQSSTHHHHHHHHHHSRHPHHHDVRGDDAAVFDQLAMGEFGDDYNEILSVASRSDASLAGLDEFEADVSSSSLLKNKDTDNVSLIEESIYDHITSGGMIPNPERPAVSPAGAEKAISRRRSFIDSAIKKSPLGSPDFTNEDLGNQRLGDEALFDHANHDENVDFINSLGEQTVFLSPEAMKHGQNVTSNESVCESVESKVSGTSSYASFVYECADLERDPPESDSSSGDSAREAFLNGKLRSLPAENLRSKSPFNGSMDSPSRLSRYDLFAEKFSAISPTSPQQTSIPVPRKIPSPSKMTTYQGFNTEDVEFGSNHAAGLSSPMQIPLSPKFHQNWSNSDYMLFRNLKRHCTDAFNSVKRDENATELKFPEFVRLIEILFSVSDDKEESAELIQIAFLCAEAFRSFVDGPIVNLTKKKLPLFQLVSSVNLNGCLMVTFIAHGLFSFEDKDLNRRITNLKLHRLLNKLSPSAQVEANPRLGLPQPLHEHPESAYPSKLISAAEFLKANSSFQSFLGEGPYAEREKQRRKENFHRVKEEFRRKHPFSPKVGPLPPGAESLDYYSTIAPSGPGVIHDRLSKITRLHSSSLSTPMTPFTGSGRIKRSKHLSRKEEEDVEIQQHCSFRPKVPFCPFISEKSMQRIKDAIKPYEEEIRALSEDIVVDVAEHTPPPPPRHEPNLFTALSDLVEPGLPIYYYNPRFPPRHKQVRAADKPTPNKSQPTITEIEVSKPIDMSIPFAPPLPPPEFFASTTAQPSVAPKNEAKLPTKPTAAPKEKPKDAGGGSDWGSLLLELSTKFGGGTLKLNKTEEKKVKKLKMMKKTPGKGGQKFTGVIDELSAFLKKMKPPDGDVADDDLSSSDLDSSSSSEDEVAPVKSKNPIPSSAKLALEQQLKLSSAKRNPLVGDTSITAPVTVHRDVRPAVPIGKSYIPPPPPLPGTADQYVEEMPIPVRVGMITDATETTVETTESSKDIAQLLAVAMGRSVFGGQLEGKSRLDDVAEYEEEDEKLAPGYYLPAPEDHDVPKYTLKYLGITGESIELDEMVLRHLESVGGIATPPPPVPELSLSPDISTSDAPIELPKKKKKKVKRIVNKFFPENDSESDLSYLWMGRQSVHNLPTPTFFKEQIEIIRRQNEHRRMIEKSKWTETLRNPEPLTEEAAKIPGTGLNSTLGTVNFSTTVPSEFQFVSTNRSIEEKLKGNVKTVRKMATPSEKEKLPLQWHIPEKVAANAIVRSNAGDSKDLGTAYWAATLRDYDSKPQPSECVASVEAKYKEIEDYKKTQAEAAQRSKEQAAMASRASITYILSGPNASETPRYMTSRRNSLVGSRRELQSEAEKKEAEAREQEKRQMKELLHQQALAGTNIDPQAVPPIQFRSSEPSYMAPTTSFVINVSSGNPPPPPAPAPPRPPSAPRRSSVVNVELDVTDFERRRRMSMTRPAAVDVPTAGMRAGVNSPSMLSFGSPNFGNISQIQPPSSTPRRQSYIGSNVKPFVASMQPPPPPPAPRAAFNPNSSSNNPYYSPTNSTPVDSSHSDRFKQKFAFAAPVPDDEDEESVLSAYSDPQEVYDFGSKMKPSLSNLRSARLAVPPKSNDRAASRKKQ